ncbi:MAG: hypothetical protein LH615_05825, partial [Ferruginibacter sp.]|nr:hypothetical protein [Ferruginibacter sp.]
MNIILFLYCLLLIACCIYLFKNLSTRQWSIETLFLSLLIIFYVFVPINIIIFGHNIYDSSIESYLFPASKYVSFSSCIITLLFVVSFILGTIFKGKLIKPFKIYTYVFNKIYLYELTSYFISIFSLICLVIYIQQYGGITSFAANIIAEKADLLNAEIVGNYTFFGKFIELAIFPILYFLYKYKTKRDYIFLLAIPLTVLIINNLFISVSKIKFIELAFIFYFTLNLRSKKLYIPYLMGIFVFVFTALPILDDVFIVAYKTLDDEGIIAVPFKIVSAILSGSLGKGEYEEFLKN